jgi:hypothetical protein
VEIILPQLGGRDGGVTVSKYCIYGNVVIAGSDRVVNVHIGVLTASPEALYGTIRQ